MRINKASDDAAGLSIASSLNADERVYAQAVRNVNDGINYLNIADGALSELSNITMRQIELAEQAANGVYSFNQRRALTAEANALVREYNRIVETTKFNGLSIIDAENSRGDLRIQAGYGANGGVSLSVGDELSRTVGTGEFGEMDSYAVSGATFNALLAADLDNDGALDLVTAGYHPDFGSGPLVWQNDGNGNFSAAASCATGSFTSRAIAVADLDNDGALDLVTADYASVTGGRTSVLLNDGHGSFVCVASYAAENECFAVSLADINGDGAADMLTSVRQGLQHYVAVQLNDGSGNFSPALTYASDASNSYDIDAADVNGDGALDLITAGWGVDSGQATVRLNDGSGHFGEAVSYKMDDGYSRALSMIDINGDGAPDLVTAGITAGLDGQATVRLNDGSGNFGEAVSYTTETRSSSALSVSDINGDGLPDIVTAGFNDDNTGQATIRLNDGNGSFGEPVSYEAGSAGSFALSLADLDADGAVDLATAGFNSAPGGLTVRLALSHEVSTISVIDMFSQAKARECLSNLRQQLDRICFERGNIGSSLSRLSVALNNLQATRENFSSAASRITDADVAEESADLVKTQITQQAASAILAQANQQPALALTLLKT